MSTIEIFCSIKILYTKILFDQILLTQSCSIKYFIQISYSYTSIYTKYNYIYMSIIEISCSIKYFTQISCSIKYF